MKTVFEALVRLTGEGTECVLVSAVGGSGSVPRKTQAHMLVTSDGRLCGTVGGGAVEGRAIVLAKQLLKSRESALETFVLHESDAQNLGMICGGEVMLHFRFVGSGDSAMAALAGRAVECFTAGRRAWLVICLDTGKIALYDGEKLTGEIAPDIVMDCLDASASRFICDGKAYYSEQLVSPGRVYIFGGGHVAQALVPVLALVDFRCVILEDRVEFADPALFPEAEAVQLIQQSEWETRLHILPEDCVCIMTRGHENDLACQAFALRTPAYYIGVIGSRRKIAAANERLREMGFSEETIARLHTPIGLPIGAQTPAEIAVSIAAEMIQCRAKNRNR